MSDDLSTYQTTPTGMQLQMCDSQSEDRQGKEGSEGVEQAEEGTEGETKDVD